MELLESTSRQLRTYSLNIAQRPASNFIVSGRLFVGSGVLSYGNNTIKVELLNVTRPYMTASGGSTDVQAYGVGPFPLSISRNPIFVNVHDRYRLVATLYDANRQVVAYTTVDINAPASSSPVSYDLRLQAPFCSGRQIGSVMDGTRRRKGLPSIKDESWHARPLRDIIAIRDGTKG